MSPSCSRPGVKWQAQLEHLLGALDTPGLRLGIIPARARLRVHPGDGFGIHDGTRVEVEGYRDCETITDPDRVALFRRAFGLLQESAVYEQDARALIVEALRGW
ncbi:Scr1 family TA system antitoxin-like transcriptional regulator [Kitasatospora sp. McL0602]|uniref:Scr1 family TA system antitoxin-like transcriptional regulator n=1 Tax=Kitasatospora sp. McL0602 TaxID=3439530 RepID=UPI003F8C68C5